MWYRPSRGLRRGKRPWRPSWPPGTRCPRPSALALCRWSRRLAPPASNRPQPVHRGRRYAPRLHVYSLRNRVAPEEIGGFVDPAPNAEAPRAAVAAGRPSPHRRRQRSRADWRTPSSRRPFGYSRDGRGAVESLGRARRGPLASAHDFLGVLILGVRSPIWRDPWKDRQDG